MTSGQRQDAQVGFKRSHPTLDEHEPRTANQSSIPDDVPLQSPPMTDDKSLETPPPVPGFLGSTSYSAVFTEGESEINLKEPPRSRGMNIRGLQATKVPSVESTKVSEGAKTLSLLADMPRYAQALEKYYQASSLSALAPYVPACTALLPEIFKDEPKHAISLATLSHKIFCRTSAAFPMPRDMVMQDYPSFLMGDNLCWDLVGLILTLAGLAAIAMDEVNVFDEVESQIDWKMRAQSMVRAGERCISFCEEYGNLNDTGVNLILSNFILHSQVFGDAGNSQFSSDKSIDPDNFHRLPRVA